MAITKTTTVRYVLVTEQSPDPFLEVCFIDTIDDAADEELPVKLDRILIIKKNNGDGNATDYSGYDQLIIDIADAIWTS